MKFAEAVVNYNAFYPKKDHSAAARIEFWEKHLGSLEISQITPEVIDQGIATLMDQPAQIYVGRNPDGTRRYKSIGRPKSDSTLNRYINALGSILKHLKKRRRLPTGWVSPLSDIQKFPENPGRVEYLTESEIERLITAAATAQWRKLPALIRLAFTTGLRHGSIMQIKWADIDFEKATIYIEKTKNGKPHVAALSPLCIQALEGIKDLSKNRKETDLVFCGSSPNKPHIYRRTFENLIAELFPGRRISFHTLRHSMASHLAANNASLLEISGCLGHSGVKLVQRYAHLSVNSRIDLINRHFS